MITEHAILHIGAGNESAFEEAFVEAKPIIESMKGFRSLKLLKGIEAPDRYLLLVEWESVEDHTVGFRKSAEYADWSRLLHHFYDPFPEVQHFA
jgi:heme-degrading monooxygenase HmoA